MNYCPKSTGIEYFGRQKGEKHPSCKIHLQQAGDDGFSCASYTHQGSQRLIVDGPISLASNLKHLAATENPTILRCGQIFQLSDFLDAETDPELRQGSELITPPACALSPVPFSSLESLLRGKRYRERAHS